MKKLFTALLMFAALIGRAQVSQPTMKPPVVIIDSVRTTNGVNYLDHIDIDNISSMNVVKNETYPHGVIYVTLKDHAPFKDLLKEKIVSLNDIHNANISSKDINKPVLYVVDNRLLMDTTGVRYISKFVREVIVVKAEDTPYFKTALPNVLLMLIATLPPNIKGLATPLLNSSAQIK